MPPSKRSSPPRAVGEENRRSAGASRSPWGWQDSLSSRLHLAHRLGRRRRRLVCLCPVAINVSKPQLVRFGDVLSYPEALFTHCRKYFEM